MATLGFALVISIVLMEWIPVTGGAGGFPSVIPRPSLGAFRFETDVSYYYLVSLVVIFFYYVTENIGGCRIGRALYAINHNELVAETLGVSASKYKLKVFMLSAFYAGIAGGLFAHYITYIAPESFSFYLIIPMLCMVVVGGLCSAKGSILGAGVLMLLPELIRYFSEVRIMPKALQLAFKDHTWHLLSYGVILLLFVLFVPGGLASSSANLADKFAHWFGLKGRSRSPVEL
jgi:branched-chain amino acid transport system permease protein